MIDLQPLSSARDAIIGKLRVRREALGLSQRVIGQLIGSHYQEVGNWERGEKTPNLATVIRWARALDCKVILEFDDENEAKRRVAELERA